MALSLTPAQIVAKNQSDMLHIASQWERVPLKFVASVQNGFAFKSEFFDRQKGVPLVRIRDVTKSETEHRYRGEFDSEYLLKSDDILIGMDGDFTAARWQGKEALLNQRVCRLALTSKLYDRDFLFLCLQPYLNAINAETSSVTVKHLSSQTVLEIPLPLPPVNEQRRIVEKIENLFAELDKGEESLRTAKAQAALYRQSLLKYAFEGHLTADWRAANPNKLEDPETHITRIQDERDTRYKKALDEWREAVKNWRDQGELDKKPKKPAKPGDFSSKTVAIRHEGWAECQLDILIGEIGQGWSPKCDENKPIKGRDWTIVKTTAVQHLSYSDRELKLLPSDLQPRPDLEIKTGDFLMTRKGPRARTGVVCLVRRTRGRILLCDTVYRFNCDETLISPDLLELALNSPQTIREIDRLKSGISDSGISLNRGKVRSVKVRFPICKEEQSEIVERLKSKLSTLDALQTDLDAHLAHSKSLRQSILKRAFSGELVDQDPTDEPAFTLLEQIKAERSAQPSTKSRSNRKPKTKSKRKITA